MSLARSSRAAIRRCVHPESAAVRQTAEQFRDFAYKGNASSDRDALGKPGSRAPRYRVKDARAGSGSGPHGERTPGNP